MKYLLTVIYIFFTTGGITFMKLGGDSLELGLKEVDVLRVTGMTEEQKRKYRPLANKTGEKLAGTLSCWTGSLKNWIGKATILTGICRH